MQKKYKTRKGSVSIIAIYIFILILSSSTMILYFATLQASLSKNQLEKIQARYRLEDNLNRFIYDRENINKYIKKDIFRTYRTQFVPHGGLYDIKLEKDDVLKDNIKKASFRLEDVHGRENIILSIASKYENISSNIVGTGPCISKIFELKKSFISENNLSIVERELFLEFIDRIENENCEYDCNLDGNSKKVNINENISLELDTITTKSNKLFSKKKFIINSDMKKDLSVFEHHSMILNLKRNESENKNLIVGELDNKNLIKMNGILYIEGDLIINQDFEFSGLIIINNGSIIINSSNKPKVNGSIYYKGKDMDLNKIDIRYDQEAIYKEGSFLPGFIDIEIDTIRRY